jgi:hypothetical protein
MAGNSNSEAVRERGRNGSREGAQRSYLHIDTACGCSTVSATLPHYLGHRNLQSTARYSA